MNSDKLFAKIEQFFLLFSERLKMLRKMFIALCDLSSKIVTEFAKKIFTKYPENIFIIRLFCRLWLNYKPFFTLKTPTRVPTTRISYTTLHHENNFFFIRSYTTVFFILQRSVSKIQKS